MGLVKVAELHRVITKGCRLLVKSLGAVYKEPEVSQVFQFEESVLVLFEFGGKIHELLVMDAQITDVISYVVETS